MFSSAIYNADEMLISWKPLSQKSLTLIFETATQSYKVVKEQITDIMYALHNGKHSLPLPTIRKDLKTCLKMLPKYLLAGLI